jgi:hypothetical protein
VFFERFVNLSNTTFNNKEINLLETGFKFNIKPDFSKNNLELLGVETELALRGVTNNADNKYIAAKIIKNKGKQSNVKSHYNSDKANLKNIKIKTENNNLIFTKADKGNTVIVLNNEDYINQTVSFLNPDKYKVLSKDPTVSYQKDIKQAIDNSQSILDPKDKYKLTIMNPQPPKLYSLIKLHIENYPIRPVVSFVSAPSTKVSNKLINIIKENCKFTAKHSIKNSYDLINKIRHIKIPPNAKLISFDVQNLFPSVPPNDTIKLVQDLLDKNNTNPVVKQDILNLLKTCLDQNYFQFNDKIYSSKEGLIMGNPLSPLLADIFMNDIEKSIHKHPLSNKFLYWYRYVDDIIACFTGTSRQLNTFVNNINTIHPNIKFTIELELDNAINFLDLTISKVNNSHDFSIFHKPSHTDITIHNTSTHPYQHKLAAYNSMIHRLLNVPLSECNYNKELNIIKQIAINNGYNPDIIDNLCNKKSYKMAIQLVFPVLKDINTNFKTLTYTGSNTNKISSFLKKQNLNIAYKTNNSLGRFIKNAKDKTKKFKKSGVYQLKCGSCPMVYIGQTGRSFDKRIAEHRNSFIKDKQDSTYANHLLQETHTFSEDFDILHLENKSLKLTLLESMEINKYKFTDCLLNDQVDTNSSPLLNLFN